MRARFRAVGALLCACVLLATVGCAPQAGNQQPMSVTVRDGRYMFHWCGEPTEAYQYLEVAYATFDPDRDDVLALSASGEYSFETGAEFSISLPPAGVEATKRSEIPLTDERMLVFVYTGSSEAELDGINVIFSPAKPKEIEGRWLYPSGELHDEPCEMRGAVQ